MKEIIEKIIHKFGRSSFLTIYMDGSGHITQGIFDSDDEDFRTYSFQSTNELYEILGLKPV